MRKEKKRKEWRSPLSSDQQQCVGGPGASLPVVSSGVAPMRGPLHRSWITGLSCAPTLAPGDGVQEETALCVFLAPWRPRSVEADRLDSAYAIACVCVLVNWNKDGPRQNHPHTGKRNVVFGFLLGFVLLAVKLQWRSLRCFRISGRLPF